jgi:hypothetical protein
MFIVLGTGAIDERGAVETAFVAGYWWRCYWRPWKGPFVWRFTLQRASQRGMLPSGPVGDEAAIMSANWVVLLWMSREPGCRLYKYRLLLLRCGSCLTVEGTHITPPPRGDGCSDVEASGEMDVATGACSSCGELWLRGRWCYRRGCVDWRVEGGVLHGQSYWGSRLASPCRLTPRRASRARGVALSSPSVTGPGRGRSRGSPKLAVLCPDEGRRGCTSRDRFARM